MAGAPDRPIDADAPRSLERPRPDVPLLSRLLARLRSLTFFQSLYIVYMVAGLLILTFLIPPFQKSDEPSHYYRAISLTNFDFTCSKDSAGVYKVDMKSKYADLPEMVHVWDVALLGNKRFDPDWLNLDLSNPLLNENKRVYDICNLPPPGYLPNMAGLWLGKPFANPLVGFYLGRFTGVLFFAGALLFALSLTPRRYRLPVYFFAALPMVLHQAGAISYDVVQLPLFLVIYGYLTKFAAEPGRVRRLDLALFMAALILAVNIRSLTYVPLLGFFFAVPYTRIAASKGEYAKLTAAFVAVAGLITVALAAVYVPRVNAVPLTEGDVSASRQLTFVLDDPWRFIEICYRTLVHQGDWLYLQTMGIFGWLDTPMGFLPYYVIVFALGLVFYQFMREDERVIEWPQAGLLFATIAATIACLFLSLYLVWTPVGEDQVLGLQGRYFIGLLPFTVLGISQVSLMVGQRRLIRAALVLMAAILVFNMYRTIDLRYYGPEPAAVQPTAQPDAVPGGAPQPAEQGPP